MNTVTVTLILGLALILLAALAVIRVAFARGAHVRARAFLLRVLDFGGRLWAKDTPRSTHVARLRPLATALPST